MPENFDVLPAHVVRLFLWDQLKKNGIMDAANYPSAQNPIKTLKEVPTFLQQIPSGTNPPYIVYTWGRARTSSDWFMREDQVIFLIYSHDEAVARKITQFTSELFGRQDEVAYEVNDFVRAQSDAARATLGIYDFKNITVDQVSAPGPYDAADTNRVEAMVSISIKYSKTAHSFAQ